MTKYEGAEWTRQLRYIVYDADGKVESKCEYSNLNGLIDILTSENTKIKIICCLATRLQTYNMLECVGKCFKCLNIFKGQLKHHFIEFETETGVFFSIEKVPEAYILQKSPAPRSRRNHPMVSEMRNEERRFPKEEMHLLETVIEDNLPETETVLRIIKWIQDSNLLADKYHLGENNCQHFAALLWSQLSSRPYPNPGKFGEEIPQMKNMRDAEIVPTSSAENATGTLMAEEAAASQLEAERRAREAERLAEEAERIERQKLELKQKAEEAAASQLEAERRAREAERLAKEAERIERQKLELKQKAVEAEEARLRTEDQAGEAELLRLQLEVANLQIKKEAEAQHNNSTDKIIIEDVNATGAYVADIHLQGSGLNAEMIKAAMPSESSMNGNRDVQVKNAKISGDIVVAKRSVVTTTNKQMTAKTEADANAGEPQTQ